MTGAAEHECRELPAEQLLPAAWRALPGPVRAFNPGLLADGTGWILAYRVVLGDGLRRLACCRLDAAFEVIPGSPVAFSDAVVFPDDPTLSPVARTWLADPRLHRWGGRVFVYWNSGWHEPHNHQFLQELDPRTLLPVGRARELQLAGPRRPLEKNWSAFATPEGHLHAVYSVTPHRVLRLSLAGEGPVVCDDAATTTWELPGYPAAHGGLRGGAPPVWHAGRFWSFCHSVHDDAAGYCYQVGVYCFRAGPDFAPLAGPAVPLDLARERRARREHPRLNPAVNEVIYPCGAAFSGGRWVISHGINDEACALSFVAPAAVEGCLRALPGHPP
jgi:hypothetical protein